MKTLILPAAMAITTPHRQKVMTMLPPTLLASPPARDGMANPLKPTTVSHPNLTDKTRTLLPPLTGIVPTHLLPLLPMGIGFRPPQFQLRVPHLLDVACSMNLTVLQAKNKLLLVVSYHRLILWLRILNF